MTNAIANLNQGSAMAIPAHLQRNTALDTNSAIVQDVGVAKPMVKMTGGTLSLHVGSDKPVRKQLVIVDADGMKERVSDMMDVVVVGYTDVLYAHYKRGQALGDGAPICVSVGGKHPHPNSPHKQSSACKNCPQNTDGSGNDGRGKACSKRCIAVAFDINDPERKLFAIQMPTKSYYFSPEGQADWLGFKDYILHLNKNEVPVYHLVTRVKVSPDGEFFRMDFKAVGWIDETLATVVNAAETAAELTDMRDYFEYNKENAFSATHTSAATATSTAMSTAPAAGNAATIAQLLELVSHVNPAIAAGATAALAGMGIVLPNAVAPVVQQAVAPVVQQPAPVIEHVTPESPSDAIAAAAAFLNSIGA